MPLQVDASTPEEQAPQQKDWLHPEEVLRCITKVRLTFLLFFFFGSVTIANSAVVHCCWQCAVTFYMVCFAQMKLYLGI